MDLKSSPATASSTHKRCDVCRQLSPFLFLSSPCMESYCAACAHSNPKRKCTRCGIGALTHKHYFAERLSRDNIASMDTTTEKKEGLLRAVRVASVSPSMSSRMSASEIICCADAEQHIIESIKGPTTTATNTAAIGPSPLSPSSRRVLCF